MALPELRRRGDHWLLVGGPVPPRADAMTIGPVVSVRRAQAGNERLLTHEGVHVRQWRELGWVGFPRRYLGAYLSLRWAGFGHRAAYRLIPLEAEAEAVARGEGRPPPAVGEPLAGRSPHR